MKERDIINEMKESNEYKDIQYHEYKGVHFYTAIRVGTKWVEVGPIHEEVLKMLGVYARYDKQILWQDSGHSWADGLTLQGQRNRLIEHAHEDIDYLMSGEALKEQREEYLEKRKRLREQYEFFKKLRNDKT